jgi:hypothetical protein
MISLKNIGSLLIVLSAFASCRSVQAVSNGTIHKDSVTTTYRQEQVTIKGAAVLQVLNLDSLLKESLDARNVYVKDSLTAVKNGQPVPVQQRTVVKYLTDPQTKASLSYWTDQYGKLNIGCESKDQTIQLLIAQVQQLHTELTTATKIEYKTPWYDYLIIFMLLAALIFTTIKQ